MDTTQLAKPSGTTVEIGRDGRLTVVQSGARIAVRVRQCFPWSEPTRYLSLRDDDDNEITLIADPARLDDQSRRAIEQALADAGFVLEIVSVSAIEEEVEIRNWRVETRQGPRQFQTRLDDWPFPLPHGRLLVRDVGGDLYLIGNPEGMDRRSRTLLWAFVD